MPEVWRVGGKDYTDVYEGDGHVCQCHTRTDARRIVEAMNIIAATWVAQTVPDHYEYETKAPTPSQEDNP